MEYHPNHQSLILEAMWTTTPPTEGGYYWVYDVFRFVYMVQYFPPIPENGPDIHAGEVQSVWPDPHNKQWHKLGDFTHWLGPLPKPDPPIDATGKPF